MKKLLSFLLLLSTSLVAISQKDLTGAYGFILPQDKPQPPKDKTAIPGGQLVLIKMDGNKYRFWLDVLTGPPGYNRGETDGTIEFVNDTASFDNTFEAAENPCILKFKLNGNRITVKSQSTSFNCGFGNGVSADGEYTRLRTQPVLDNKWLRKEYPSSPFAVAISAKTELFQDENCMVPFIPKRYFTKGDSFLSIAETAISIYTEQIPSPGIFIWGWIRKTDVKPAPSQ